MRDREEGAPDDVGRHSTLRSTGPSSWRRRPARAPRVAARRARCLAATSLVAAITLALAASCSSTSPPVGDATGTGGQSALEVAPSTTTLPPVVAERVLLLGDSSMVDAALAVGPAFTAAGAEVVVSDAAVGFGLTGIGTARVPSPWPEAWSALVERVDPDLSIVMMGGWDVGWINENGVDAYSQVAASAADVLTARGGRVLWLSMLPEDRVKPGGDLPDVAYSRLPSRSPGSVFYVDVGPALVGPDGTHPASFVDGGELVRSRKVDGWHLCQDGAVRIAELVNRTAAELRLAAPAPDGWQLGTWWDREEFTQSPACWSPGVWSGGGPDRSPPPPWPAGTFAPQP